MSTPVLTAVAWPYANGPRHIGHVSGFGVPSDVFSRYQRMAGNRVLMVSGTDEHGTPITVQADKEDSTPQQTADKYTRQIGNDLQGLGLSYDLFTRTTTGNHDEVTQQIFLALHRNGYVVPKTTTRRDQPVHRPHAARPLRRGHLPDLRLRRRARRPVRQLRQPARRRRPDQPEVADQRRDAEVRRDRALLPRPAGVHQDARRLAVDQDRLAPERPQLHQEPGRRHAAAADHPRPRLGRPDPARRLARPAAEAVLRLVRRGDRLLLGQRRVGARGPGTRTRGRSGGTTPTPGRTTSWARTTSPSTPRSGRRCCSGTTARATRAASPGKYGKLHLPDEIVSSEFLTMSGSKFSTSRGTRHLRRGLPARVRPGRAALLHLGRRPGDPGHRLHLGRVRPPDQLRAGQRVGQPGQPVHLDGAQERRRHPAPGGADGGRRRAEGVVAQGVRHRGRAPGPGPGSSWRRARRCGSSPRRTSTSPTRSRGSSRTTRRGATRCCTPRCRWSTTPTRC